MAAGAGVEATTGYRSFHTRPCNAYVERHRRIFKNLRTRSKIAREFGINAITPETRMTQQAQLSSSQLLSFLRP